MKRFLLLPLILAMFSQTHGQSLPVGTNSNAINSSPAAFPGMCKSDKKHVDLMLNDPAYAAKRQEYHQQMTDYLKLAPSQRALSGTVTIPVVVHVIHLGEAEGNGTNISDAQIQSAIDNLNDAYSNTGYNGLDIEVQFALAVRDESCQSTDGINRIDGTGVSGYSTDGITDANEVDVKNLSKWNNSQYYNIWIVSEIDGNNGGSGTQGYAYFPGASADYDGAVILYNAFGYDPTGALGYELKSYTNYNVTAIHEIGHGLDLYHTFQGDDADSDGTADQCPDDTDPTTDGDLCADTDAHRRDDSDCDVALATCHGVTGSDVYNNFMAYSSDDCQDRFTSDQKDRMRAALELERPGLVTSLGATAISGTEPTPSVTCEPQTSNLSNSFDMGITEFTIGSTSYGSSNSVDDGGYMTQWCSSFSLDEGTTYSLEVVLGSANTEDVAVYIDYNNDGDFDDTDETIFTSNAAFSHSGNFTTPSGFSGETVWVRVISDWAGNNISGPCYVPTYGQVEDYSAVLNSTCTDPDVPTLSHSGTICDGSSASITITGDLNSADNWYIYTGSCGGTQVGTTSNGSYTVTPSSPSTTYYIRGEGGCVTAGSCGQITLTVTDNEDATFSYASATYCQDDSDPTPSITGDLGGSFTFSPSGLSINGSTGLIDLSASTAATYTVTYTTAGTCSDNQDFSITVQDCNIPTTKVRPVDCGRTVSSFLDKFYCDYISSASQYEWEFTDPSLNVTTAIKGGGSTEMTFDRAGLSDLGTTYDVRVRAYVNGQWGNYSTICQVTSPATLPTTQVRTADCGTTLSSFADKFYCDYLANATQYEWQFTDPSLNVTTVVVSTGSTQMKLSTAGLTDISTTYSVKVKAYVNNQWGDYGSACNITSPGSLPSSAVRSVDCGKTLTSFTEKFYCEQVTNATKYEWEFTDPSMNVITKIKNSSSTAMTLSQAGISDLSTTYDVRVKPYVYGSWGDYGAICEITSPATAAIAINDGGVATLDQVKIGIFADESLVGEDVDGISEAIAYPNPFEDHLNVDFGGNTETKEIKIYNSLGQLMNTIVTSDNLVTLELNELTEGVYMMQVVSGEQMKVIRIVKK